MDILWFKVYAVKKSFFSFIRFIYTGEWELHDYATAFKILYAAKKYFVNKVKSICETFLAAYNLSASDVWVFLENSILLNSDIVKEHCVNFLKKGIEPALEESSFSVTKEKTMDVLLSLDDLDIDEDKLLKNVIQWADYQSKMEGADSFKDILKPLLSKVTLKPSFLNNSLKYDIAQDWKSC